MLESCVLGRVGWVLVWERKCCGRLGILSKREDLIRFRNGSAWPSSRFQAQIFVWLQIWAQGSSLIREA